MNSPASFTEQEIIARVRAGETELYSVLMRRYQRRLSVVAGNILKDQAEVEDVLQDAHMHALARFNQFEGRSSFLTWLTRITINEALSRVRGKPRFVALEPDVPDGTAVISLISAEPSPEELALTKDLFEKFEAAIRTLPKHYRAVFTTRALEELPTSQAAAKLGIKQECVKTRLHRAKALMRQKLVSARRPAREPDPPSARVN